MSTDYKAYTVIGVKIPEEKLHVTTKKRGCSHKEAASKHCAECGKPMWITAKEEIPAYITYQEDSQFAGLDGIDEGTDRDDIYVGEVLEHLFEKIPDIEKLKEKIRLALEPLKLWDEKKFGIYTVLYCSY